MALDTPNTDTRGESFMSTTQLFKSIVVVLVLAGLFISSTPSFGATYTSPRALAVGDIFRVTTDGFTGDEATAQPKTDANNGLNGDNPYYQRTNVARAHCGGVGCHWYTSNHQEVGEPDPNGPQWVDYKPPFDILGIGRYRVRAYYKGKDNRATYEAQYILTHTGGTYTVGRVQQTATDTLGEVDMGTWDLGPTGYLRVNDPGPNSISFMYCDFTYMGPTDMQAPSVPTNVQATSSASTIMHITWTASTDNLAVAGYKIFRNGTQVGTSTTTSYTDTGLTASTAYSYTVSAYDTVGNNSAQSSPPAVGTTLATDSTPPSVPTNVQTGTVSGSTVQLTWTASTDNRGVLGYRIFRNGGQVGTSATTSFTDGGLLASTSYSYTVAAYDGDGNSSAQSSPPAVVTTSGAIIVSSLVPTNYVVTNFDINSLIFIDRTYTITSMPAKHRGRLGIRTANDDKDNASLDFHFTVNQPVEVYLCLRSVLTPSTPLLSGFVDTGDEILTTDLSPDYTIWRKTYSAGVVSLGPKPSAGDTKSMYFVLLGYPEIPDSEAPSVPTNVTATAQSPTSIQVSWTASTDDVAVAGYKIFRNGNQVGTSTSTSYTNSGLQPETTYSYTVSAHDAVGNNSAQSSPPATATTPADTVPPSITQHPQAQTICDGATATFTVAAAGSGTLSYQWQRNGSNLTNGGHYSGATTATLIISDADSNDEGSFRCVVTSAFGTATSNAADLTLQECSGIMGISQSKHFVTYNNQTVFMVGDNATQTMMQNKNMNYRQWVDDCDARGIRSVHIWSFVPPRQKQDGSKIESRWGYVYPGATPWARNTSGSLATDQLYRWNLRTFDESAGGYWQRLRDLCAYAKTKNMLVGITVFFGWPKDDADWLYHPFNSVNGGHLTTKTDVAQIYSPGTEVFTETWSDAWPNTKKTQWVWEKFSKKLIDDCGSMGNVWFEFMDEHSYTEGNMGDHFLTFFKSRGMIWGDWDARRSNVDIVYQQPSGTDKNSGTVTYVTKTPTRPFVMLESGPYMGTDFRTAFWTTAIGGGHYHYQSDSDQETATTGCMGYDPNVANSNRTAYKSRLSWLGHCSRLFNEHVTYIDQLVPSNGLCSSGIYALAYPGREYVAYAKIGSTSTFTVNLGAVAGTAICRWYNPQTGVYGTQFTRSGGSTQSFTKPDANDWALHITTVMDTQPPSVPTNVTAVAQTAVRILVSWTASTDDVGVTGYRIYRNGIQVGTSATTSYADTGLSPETSYSYTVAAYDGAGNLSAQSSPPVIGTTPAGDGQAPSVPTNVSAAPQSTSSILITWTASTDNVGVTGYRVYRNGTQVGTPTGTSYTDTGLTQNTTYSYTVSANDAMGNNSAQSSPPAVATTWSATTVTLMKANFNESDIDSRWTIMKTGCTVDATGTVAHSTSADACGTPAGFAYRQVSTGGDRCMIWKSAFSSAGYTDVKLTFWHRCDTGRTIRAHVLRNGTWTQVADVGSATEWTMHEVDLTGTITGLRIDLVVGTSSATARVDCISITAVSPDTSAPTVPANVMATPQSVSAVNVTWTASADNVGVAGYKIFRNGGQVGTSATTSYTDSGLAAGTTYSYTVSAYDGAGNNSAQSSPAAVATTFSPVDIAVAKQQGNGEDVVVAGKVVTAIFGTYFYVEEQDRFSGIKVVPLQMPEEMDVNDLVNVSGKIGTDNGERYIYDAVVTSAEGSGDVNPVGVSNSGVGGGNWMYNSETGAGQRGIQDAVGSNNIGLLITTWGRFTYVDASTFVVDDGSGNPIRCAAPVPARVTLNDEWQYVAVTGISSCEDDDGEIHRKLLVRGQNDIVPIQ